MSKHPIMRVFDCHVCTRSDRGLEFLILRRASGKIYAGNWRMLGGKIKDHASLQGLHRETAWQAALRELREETGFVATELYTVPYVNHFYEHAYDRINAIPVFAAVVEKAAPALDSEHTEWQWLDASQAAELLPWPAQREGLMAAHQLLAGAHEGDPVSLQLLEHMRIAI